MPANKTNPVNWFEIPVIDMNRARKFYSYVFECDLSLQEMGPLTMAWFPMVQGVPGATGSLVKADDYTPSHTGTLVYFSVESIEKTLERIREMGGMLLSPKTGIGQYGFVAHFEDSEGNRIALHSEA